MAIHSKGYLSEYDIEYIQNSISSYFAEESEGLVLKDINKLKNKIDLIIQKVKITKDNFIARNTREKEELIIEAYLIIFLLREFLLNEEIDYRYYYNTDDGQAKVISFSEKNILQFIHIGKTSLEVAASKLQKTVEDQKYQKLLNNHYKNLMAGVQDIKGKDSKTFKVVHSYIMDKYGMQNPGLKNKKDPRRYQLFNMGHIFEAMDIAFSEAINADQISNFDFIERLMYGSYLYYDSIGGVKGGDNPITMTQIKANSATFLDYSTILNILIEIQDMLNNNLDSKMLKDKIKALYIEETKYQDINACNEMIDNAVNKIFVQLHKNELT